MAKWADYLVSAVRYDEDNSKIDSVMVHEDKGDEIGNGTKWTRKQVINIIEKYPFCTIYKNSKGKWEKGANINVVTYNNEKYLRTDPNKTPKDNLGNLPEF